MASHREVLFPRKATIGANISPVFNTTINQAGNGREVRNAEWSRGLTVADIHTVLKSKPVIEEMISFLRAVARGAAYSFNFKDPSDCTAGVDLSNGSESAHDFATGDGVQTVFPLYKIYSYGGFTEERRIQKPISAITVYDNGVALVSGYSVNYTTGTITFTVAPAAAHTIGWSGTFAIPCRFVDDKFSLVIGSTSADFSAQLMEVVVQ